ncbi:MAG: hypothetical protein JRF28_10400 [Deltaproteobacteria bacterium]|nr:hypothetical protein [Deltaproteobacteria bacterium]
MNNLVRLMLVCMLILGSMLMIKAAPAYAAEAMQMWRCELEGDTTEDEVITMARDWVKAAKTMAGGKGLKAYVHFPVAVNLPGKIDVLFVVVAPSFAEWGKFWDNYSGSPANEVGERNREKIICPDSALWESVKIK